MKWFLCGPSIYEFEGTRFEFSRATGPWPLKKDGDPKKRIRASFWDLFDRWSSHPDRESFRIGGGCKEIG